MYAEVPVCTSTVQIITVRLNATSYLSDGFRCSLSPGDAVHPFHSVVSTSALIQTVYYFHPRVGSLCCSCCCCRITLFPERVKRDRGAYRSSTALSALQAENTTSTEHRSHPNLGSFFFKFQARQEAAINFHRVGPVFAPLFSKQPLTPRWEKYNPVRALRCCLRLDLNTCSVRFLHAPSDCAH